MSFADDVRNGTFNKKKKKTFAESVRDGTFESSLPKLTEKEKEAFSKSEDIAPVKKEEEEKWYQKILKGSEAFEGNLRRFDDGYDFGDLTKTGLETIWDTGTTAVSTVADIGTNIGKGAVKVGEGAGKLITSGIAQVHDWAGNEEKADLIRGRIAGTVPNAFGTYGAPLSQEIDKVQEKYIDPNSVSGHYADMVAESIGYSGTIAAVGSVAPALAMPTVFASSSGHAAEEVYKKDDVSGLEAWAKILGTGTIETVAESMFGLMGVGGTNFTNKLTNEALERATSKAGKILTRLGIAGLGESAEEFLSYAGNHLYDNYIVDKLGDADFSSEWDNKEVAEQMAIAFVSAGISQGAMTSSQVNVAIKETEEQLGRKLTDKEKASLTQGMLNEGNTKNEQQVLDKLVEREVAAKEKDGTKVTRRDKNKIIKELQEDLQKGLIDTADIESMFGGEAYTRLQEAKTRAENIQKEIDVLDNMKNAEITVKQMKRLNSLEQRLKEIDIRALQTEVDNEIFNKIGENNNFLQRSYYERSQKGKKFEYEITEETSEIRKKAYITAEKSKANNSTKTRNYIENMVKIGEDTGTNIIFVNNEQIKRHYDKTGAKMVDGYVNNKGELVLNIDSPKALNKTVGHEVAHLFEGTKEGDVYRKVLKEYAELKGDYQAKKSSMAETYKNVKANLENEVIADLTGDYLFSNDLDFINHLSAKEPNVFKKVYDYIKHLAKQLTAGSKEARQLEKVRYRFEQAYRSVQKTEQNNTELNRTEQNTKYSMTDNKGRTLAKEQEEYFKDSKVRDEEGRLLEVYHGTSEGGFNVFDPYNGTTWVTPSKSYADQYVRYASEKNKIYELYANITNPIFVGEIGDEIDTNSLENLSRNTGLSMEELQNVINDVELNEIGGELENIWEITNSKAFRTLAKKKGYDGIEAIEGEARTYGVFDSNQIKNVDNLKPTENPDIRYSLSEEGKLVDDKGNDVTLEASDTGNHNSLMAIHNLSEAKLKGILELGGFPVPSIAIVDTDKFTFTNFGEISVLFNKNTIDPTDKRNRVYSRDAYTPRFPQMGYKTSKDTVRNIREMAYKHGGYDNIFLSRVFNSLDEPNIDNSLKETQGNVVEAFKDNNSFKYLYLMENGIPFETVYKTKNYSSYFTNEELQNFLNEYTGDKDKLNNLSSEERDALQGHLTELYLENQVKGLNEEDAETYKKIMRDDGWQLDAHRIYDITLGAYQLHKYGEKKEIDKSQTEENVKKNTDQADYEKWLENIFKNLIEKKGIRNNKDWYTPSGTPRKFEQLYDDYNLENVVKAITRQKEAGSEKNFAIGVGELAGASSKRFASIEEIREQKDTLMNIEEDEYAQKLTRLGEAFRGIQSDVLETVERYRDSIEGMVWTDRAYENDLLTIAQKFGEGKKITTSQIINEFAKDNFKVTEEQATALLELLKQTRDLPTQYFEAKPKRAIELNEVQAIVIPNDTDIELKKQLTDAGLYVVEYDPNIEGDRQTKINQFDDLKFSLSNPNNVAPRQRGQIYSEDVKVQDVIGDIEKTIDDLFDRINKIYARVTVDAEDYAPVNEANLPNLEKQYEENFKTINDDIAPVEELVETNIGKIPVAEYRDMMAQQSGFDDYADMRRQGYKLGNKYDTDIEPITEEPIKGITLDDKVLRDEMLGLGVAKKHNTKELKQSAEELNALISEGKTDDATLNTFVDGLGDRLLIEHDPYEYDDAVKGARDYIRTTRLYVSDEVKNGIGQWNEFRKANMGKMKLTNDPKATPVDSAYQELQGLYGTTLFPDDIYNPADQLELISDLLGASKGILPIREYLESQYGTRAWDEMKESFINRIKTKITEAAKLKEASDYTDYHASIPIDDSYIPEVSQRQDIDDIVPMRNEVPEFEDVATQRRMDFDSNVITDDPVSDLEKKKARALKKLGSKENFIKDKVTDFYNETKKLTKGVRASYDLSRVLDVAFKDIEKITEGMSEEDIKAERNRIWRDVTNSFMNIKAKPFETVNPNSKVEAMIRQEIDRQYNAKLQGIDDMKEVKPKKAIQEEQRELARKLIGDTSTWVDKSMGIKYRINTLKRNLRDIIKDVNGNPDIKRADAIYEEYEGKYNKNEAKLKVEFNRLAQPFRDLKLTRAEEVYVQMLGELRHNPDTSLLPDKVEEFYEANKDKIDTGKVEIAIDNARDTYDELFNRINQTLRNQGMKELEYRKGYFPHFVEEKQGLLAKLFDWKIRNEQIPTDIAGLTELNNPERSWQSFNKHREGDTTDYNFSKGFDTYVRGALDWIYHIEDIQKRRALENEIRYQHSAKGVKEKIDAIYNNTELDADEKQAQIEAVFGVARTPLNNFVTDLRTGTNILAGKKSSLDRSMEYNTNRQIYSTMTNISNRVSGNMIVGSLSSALTNFIPITQSWLQVSPLSSLGATKEVIANAIKDDGTIAKSTFLTNRMIRAENLYKSNWDKASEKVAIMTDVIDSITSQVVWRAKYNENIKNGMSEIEAINNADIFAENVIAGRSRGNEPTIFHSKNPLTKMFTAFQLEVNNQYGYMFKDAPIDIDSKNKLIKGYATAFIGAFIYNALYSSLTGRDAAFDPIGLIADILKELGFGGDDEEEEKSAAEKFEAITEDLVQQLPFVGGLFGGGRVPLSAAIPYENPIEMVKGTGADLLNLTDGEKREKAFKDLTSEWLKPVTYLALPFGGGQISKTVKGLSMYDEDLPVAGSYTNGGDLRFTADESTTGKIKSAIFGQWASKSAQEYVDSGFQLIKKKNIDELVDLGMTSTEYRKYRKGLKDAGTTNEEKIEYINSLDVPISHKNIMTNNVLKRDYEVDMTGFTNYDEFDFSYKNPEKYDFLQANNISYEEYTTSKERKEAYDWAYQNPESYAVSKAVTDDIVLYRKYKKDLDELKNIEDENGKVLVKAQVRKLEYINNLDIDGVARSILYKSIYKSYDDDNYDIVEYLNNRDDISAEEMTIILKKLGMEVDSQGNISW